MAEQSIKNQLTTDFVTFDGFNDYYTDRIQSADSKEALMLIREALFQQTLAIKTRLQDSSQINKEELNKQIIAIPVLNELIESRIDHVPEKNANTFSELFAQGVLTSTASALIFLTILGLTVPPLAMITGYLIISLVVAFNIKTIIENYDVLDFSSLKALVNNPENVKLFLSLAASCELLFYTFGEELFTAAIAISSVTIVFSFLSLLSAYGVYQRQQALKQDQKALNDQFDNIMTKVNETFTENHPLLSESSPSQKHFGTILKTADLSSLSQEEKQVLELALDTISETKSVEMCETCLDRIETILGKNHPELMSMIQLKTQTLYTDKESIGNLKKRVIADASMIIVGMSLHLALFIPGVSAVHMLFTVLYALGTIGMGLFIYNEFKEMKHYNSAFKSGLSVTSTSVTAMFACILWTTVLGAGFALNPLLIIPALIVLAASTYLYQRYAQQAQQAQIEKTLKAKIKDLGNDNTPHPEFNKQMSSDSLKHERSSSCDSPTTTIESSISSLNDNGPNSDEDDEGEGEGTHPSNH